MYLYATDLVRTTAQVLAEAGIRVPDQQYVVVGEQPAASVPIAVNGPQGCTESIVVTVTGPQRAKQPFISRQPDARSRGPSGIVWQALFRISIWRCYPADAVPSIATLDAEAHADLADRWQLARGLAYRWSNPTDPRTGRLFPSVPVFPDGEQQVDIGDVSTLGPQGGVRAAQCTVTVALREVYDPASP